MVEHCFALALAECCGMNKEWAKDRKILRMTRQCRSTARMLWTDTEATEGGTDRLSGQVSALICVVGFPWQRQVRSMTDQRR